MAAPLIFAVPKGRILEEALPLLARAGVVPEAAFSDKSSRALAFATSREDLRLIRVRAFDVATFVAHGAAQAGIVGSDVIDEFAYADLYAPVDLDIGHCRLSVAEPREPAKDAAAGSWASHARVATKYPNLTRRHFERLGVQAECVKLNGAMELAPSLGLAQRIVDLVSSGRTLVENGLVETSVIMPVSARLIVNRAALKTDSARLSELIDAFRTLVAPRRQGRLMRHLDSHSADFAAAFDQLVRDRRESDDDVARDVADILNEVKLRGDEAVAEYTAKFDGHDLGDGWQIAPEACRDAFEALDPTLRAALELAAERIRAYHEAQLPEARDHTDAHNVRMGARWRAVDAAGLYVPGGRAAYPSSLLMNAIPAKVAGVERLAVVTPTPKGQVNPLVLAAAHIAGVDELWRIGGAQAVAALAYGTKRIAPVDVITGPGNAWVAEAKRQLYGVVGIDMVAGPSEILVIADGANDPEWIAADLMSQAEHDPAAQSILITDDAKFADRVADHVAVELAMLPTAKVAQASWTAHGTIIVVRDLAAEAPALANRLAAEHVELAVADPEPLFAQIRHAGSVFLGRMTPEAVGDYVAGPNHVLPTGRRARFASGLSVLDFMKRTSFISLGDGALEAIGPAAIALAEAEGLSAHARSIELRLGI